jgi:hypothetical protein
MAKWSTPHGGWLCAILEISHWARAVTPPKYLRRRREEGFVSNIRPCRCLGYFSRAAALVKQLPASKPFSFKTLAAETHAPEFTMSRCQNPSSDRNFHGPTMREPAQSTRLCPNMGARFWEKEALPMWVIIRMVKARHVPCFLCLKPTDYLSTFIPTNPSPGLLRAPMSRRSPWLKAPRPLGRNFPAWRCAGHQSRQYRMPGSCYP